MSLLKASTENHTILSGVKFSSVSTATLEWSELATECVREVLRMSAIVLPGADGKGARGPAPLVVLGWTQPPHRCATTVHRCKRNACESIPVPPLLCYIVFVALTHFWRICRYSRIVITSMYFKCFLISHTIAAITIGFLSHCLAYFLCIFISCCLSLFVPTTQLLRVIGKLNAYHIIKDSATKKILSSVKIIKRLPRHNEIGVTEHTLTTLLGNLAW